jgi:hypothetical protein
MSRSYPSGVNLIDGISASHCSVDLLRSGFAIVVPPRSRGEPRFKIMWGIGSDLQGHRVVPDRLAWTPIVFDHLTIAEAGGGLESAFPASVASTITST